MFIAHQCLFIISKPSKHTQNEKIININDEVNFGAGLDIEFDNISITD